MILDIITHLIAGFFLSVIGALPFGLVNLTVLDTATKNNTREALKISHGAAVIEVIFGMIAILAGSMIQKYIHGNYYINFLSIVIIGSAGFFFLMKRRKVSLNNNGPRSYGFIKGIILNIISIQVLIFWLIATGILAAHKILVFNFLTILVFAFGIYTGKMTVLWFYIYLSKILISKSAALSGYMNRIIGSILLLLALIQFVRI